MKGKLKRHRWNESLLLPILHLLPMSQSVIDGPHCMSPWLCPINSMDCRQVMVINRFCMSTHNLPILKLYAMLWFYSSIVCESGALVRIRRTYSDPVKYLASSLHGCMGWCGGFPPSSLSCWERWITIVNLTRFIWHLEIVGALGDICRSPQVVMMPERIYNSHYDNGVPAKFTS